MTKIEINAQVAEAIELLRNAQPGRPSSERSENRKKAGQILESLGTKNLFRASDELTELLAIYA